jgi:hypothetical protein
VSEKRQIGTREVIDKNGKKKTAARRSLIADSLGMNSSEKYFDQARERIVRTAEACEKLARMDTAVAAARPLPSPGKSSEPSTASPAKPSSTPVMTKCGGEH